MDISRHSSSGIIYEKSVPIHIKSNNLDTNKNDQYSLNQNFFDPNKASPPSKWNARLRERLIYYVNK